MMKKTVISCLLMAFVVVANAQQSFPQQVHDDDHDHDGRVFMGGSLMYWNDFDEKSQSLDLCPEIGYLFNDKWGVGLLLGYEYETEKIEAGKQIAHGLKFSPFARYYYIHKGPFNLFVDGGVGLNWQMVKTPEQMSFHKSWGFEAGIRPGGCVDLAKGLCLCLRIGFVGYRNNYFMGEEPELGNSGFGIRFAPEDLLIGLEIEF